MEQSTQVAQVLEAAQELVQIGSWRFDVRTRQTLLSDPLYRILGLEPQQASIDEARALSLIHPDDRERVARDIALATERPMQPQDGFDREVRLVRADGVVRDTRARIAPERDQGGAIVAWLGTVQDISDQRVSERELRAHHAVSQALREWEAFDQGVIDLLGLMATALEYQMASLWLWDQGLRALYCRAFWSEPGRDAAQFELAKRSMNFRPGEGKPGCAWQTQKPVVTPDAATDPVFQPRDAAVMGGIKSSLAFPALGPDGPIAVLSFYGFEHRTVSDSLTRTLSAIGHELGNFLSTRRDELDPRPLTPRELEVLRVAAEGNTGPQIAASLFISPATVKTHFDNIYEKLGVSDRAAAVAQAIRLGLIR